MSERAWVADSVLPAFDATVIPLGRADDGELSATLLRADAPAPTSRAVLYLHGFVDYFFHEHVADAFRARGWDFYAVDMRRHGRSLRPGHRPNYTTDLAEYHAEIDAAIDIIRREDGHDTLVLLGHSTGGLVASHYANSGARRKEVNAVVLNNPFFAFHVPSPRNLLLPIVDALGAIVPWGADPSGLPPQYGRSLHVTEQGEWDYDLRWKPLKGFPIFFGWVRAIRRAQHAVARGLQVQAPVLLLHATASMFPRAPWDEAYRTHDIVLDVGDMKRLGPGLGSDVTLHPVQDGIHDLFLAKEPVRRAALDATLAWLDAKLGTPIPTGIPA